MKSFSWSAATRVILWTALILVACSIWMALRR